MHLMLATELQTRGRRDEAIVEYERVRALRPDDVVAWNNLAWLYHERNDSRRALEYARQAMKLAPNRVEVLDTHGWIELHAGDPAEGLRAIREAAYASSNPAIRYHLA